MATQQSAGLTLEWQTPEQFVSTRVGLSLVETRAHFHTSLTDDPTTVQLERFRTQGGVEVVTDARLRLDSSITYVGRLGALGAVDNLRVWSVRSDNQFRIQVWKAFGIIADVTILHDIRQNRRTQFKQMVSFGFLKQF